MPLWKENTNELSHSPRAMGWPGLGWGSCGRVHHPEASSPLPCPTLMTSNQAPIQQEVNIVPELWPKWTQI